VTSNLYGGGLTEKECLPGSMQLSCMSGKISPPSGGAYIAGGGNGATGGRVCRKIWGHWGRRRGGEAVAWFKTG